MKTVGIIGGAGFIGSYVTKKFLENGYKVKVSAYDISRKEKYAHLAKLPHAENMNLVPLDVQDQAQLQSFVDGCEMIVHGGTPFQLDVADPGRDLFDPTVKGTENFLAIASQSSVLEKVVFIASVAAFNTNFPLPPKGKKEGDQITEEDTPYFSEQNHPYTQAKFVANQTVEKFISEHADPGFEITTVSPVGVMGMAMSDREDSTSMGLQYLIKHKIAPNDFIKTLYDLDVYWALVDVEDVAEGVYKAAITKGIHGRNYLLTSESYRISVQYLILNQQEPAGQPKIIYSNDLARKGLGISFRPASVPLRQYSSGDAAQIS
ncbi:NAD-dependent epimerase/dehydratase family protein [Catalinimonas sp. 4WD22]|uniref:NAD-dependent epimerase/dehydratase family protein n=1 Tax=Catalinimonas locisalis TaxID=3133978 RepID=UPI0031016A27